MLQSELFYRAKKKIPQKKTCFSARLLLRADFIEKSSAGVYRFLPLGLRVLKKIEQIIREEMERLGAQEVLLPALQNKTLWEETGRWEKIDPPLFKFQDRLKRELALGSTHEEEITDILRKRVSSFRDLPLALFQIQTKFRDELRPSGGLLRTREFLMKDLYSFHQDKEDLKKFYSKVIKSYFAIFKKCDLVPTLVEASVGTIGGKVSHEFMVEAEAGEDKMAVCKLCGFGANIEKIGSLKTCPQCQKALSIKNSIELAHVFMLEDLYSQKMKAFFKGKDGKPYPIQMGCYGIGVGRLMAAVVEIHHDKNGIIWPKNIAPFQIHLLEIESHDLKVRKAAKNLYQKLRSKNCEVLYDDRKDKSPGEKLVEADLIGIPIRVVISKKTIDKKSIEFKLRNQKKARLLKIVEFFAKIK